MSALQPGLTGEATLVVTATHTAKHLKSGGVEVLSTPIMVALMEEAARYAVENLLEPGQMTVGTALNVSHLAATPVGMRVTARATLTAVDGRRLTFKVEAYDEHEKIGEGTHQRVIINLAKFMLRVQAKI